MSANGNFWRPNSVIALRCRKWSNWIFFNVHLQSRGGKGGRRGGGWAINCQASAMREENILCRLFRGGRWSLWSKFALLVSFILLILILLLLFLLLLYHLLHLIQVPQNKTTRLVQLIFSQRTRSGEGGRGGRRRRSWWPIIDGSLASEILLQDGMFILTTNWWILGTPGSVDAGSGRRSDQMKAFVAFVANLSLLANIWDVSVIIILAKITLVTKRKIQKGGSIRANYLRS